MKTKQIAHYVYVNELALRALWSSLCLFLGFWTRSTRPEVKSFVASLSVVLQSASFPLLLNPLGDFRKQAGCQWVRKQNRLSKHRAVANFRTLLSSEVRKVLTFWLWLPAYWIFGCITILNWFYSPDFTEFTGSSTTDYSVCRDIYWGLPWPLQTCPGFEALNKNKQNKVK